MLKNRPAPALTSQKAVHARYPRARDAIVVCYRVAGVQLEAVRVVCGRNVHFISELGAAS